MATVVFTTSSVTAFLCLLKKKKYIQTISIKTQLVNFKIKKRSKIFLKIKNNSFSWFKPFNFHKHHNFQETDNSFPSFCEILRLCVMLKHTIPLNAHIICDACTHVNAKRNRNFSSKHLKILNRISGGKIGMLG